MWDPTPEAYMAVGVPNIPNFFMYLGPSGSSGSGSFLAMLEFVVEYIIKCTKKLQREYFSSMEPTWVFFYFQSKVARLICQMQDGSPQRLQQTRR